MNTLSFTGNIGKDAVLRYTPEGKAVVSLNVPIKSGFGKSEKISWVKCTMWDKRAEALAKYLLKGTLIGVVGEVSLDEFRANDGSKRAQIAVKVQDITLLGAKTDSPDPSSVDEVENITVARADELAGDFPF